MKTRLLNPALTKFATVTVRALRWMAIDGAIGAVCGALFGAMMGVFGLLLDGEAWNLISLATYTATCGAIAGVLVGASGAVLEGNEALEPVSTPFESTLPKHAPVAVARMAVGLRSSQRMAHNRLIDFDRHAFQNKRNPSRN